MKNTWLDIPISDLEAHMSMPHVDQAMPISVVQPPNEEIPEVTPSPFRHEK